MSEVLWVVEVDGGRRMNGVRALAASAAADKVDDEEDDNEDDNEDEDEEEDEG